jgi:predicted ATPase
MTDAAIEWWGKAGDQALRRSAFQEAIAHLGKAIEMADAAEEGAPRAQTDNCASRVRGLGSLTVRLASPRYARRWRHIRTKETNCGYRFSRVN